MEENVYAVAVNLEDVDSGLITLQQTSLMAVNRFEAIGKAVHKFLINGTLLHSYKVTLNSGNGEDISEILDLLAAGYKIAAIKKYHEMTSLGLKESKEAIEKIQDENNINYPGLRRR